MSEIERYEELEKELDRRWRGDITLPVKTRLRKYNYSPDGPYISALLVFEDSSRGTLNTGEGVSVSPTTCVVGILPDECFGWVVELSKIVDMNWDPNARNGRGEYSAVITGWRVERITRNGKAITDCMAYGYGLYPDIQWIERGKELPKPLHEYVQRV